MKSQILVVLTALSLTGCIAASNKPSYKLNKSYGSNVIDFKPTDTNSRSETKGQVICEPVKPCTELTFNWQKQSNGLYRIHADLYDPTRFEIRQINFDVDGRSYTFNTNKASTTRNIANSNIINSSNYIEVPITFINAFYRANDIGIVVVTDGESISHNVLKNGNESLAYKTFRSGYSQFQPN